MNSKYSQGGFSLVELILVIAIIGILSSIAIPSYNGYIIKGKRSEGRAYLMDLVSRQERFYSDCNQYASTITATGTSSCTTLTMRANTSSDSGEYGAPTIVLSDSNQDFDITITPANFTDAKCASLSIDETGAKTFTGTGSQAICW